MNGRATGLALAGFAACALAAAGARAEEIRIEVLRAKPSAALDAPGARFAAGSLGAALPLQASKLHQLRAAAGELFFDGAKVQPPLVARPGTAPLRLDGRVLPGRIEAYADATGLVLINALDLEDYVAAVVSSEMPSSWPAAALEAQAVAARTYAVAEKIAQGPGARAHLGASVLDQVYAGAAHPAGAARKAAQATEGEVLTWGSAPIAAWFSSACGGRGESGEAAFNLPAGSAPYSKASDDGDFDWCCAPGAPSVAGRASSSVRGAPRLGWTVREPLEQLSATLRRAGRLNATVTGLAVAKTTASGRVSRLRLLTAHGGAAGISGAELRQLLGYSALPSLLFTVEVEGGVAIFRGRGSGHGVGLCQWGARGRAARGQSVREILSHYYPGAEVRRMY